MTESKDRIGIRQEDSLSVIQFSRVLNELMEKKTTRL